MKFVDWIVRIHGGSKKWVLLLFWMPEDKHINDLLLF